MARSTTSALLRAELERRGHRFFSTGDTEVILRGYAEWGEGMVARLHGMFAFALYRPEESEASAGP
jgi:asparagine synthase (glutamine-hydrolysing)